MFIVEGRGHRSTRGEKGSIIDSGGADWTGTTATTLVCIELGTRPRRNLDDVVVGRTVLGIRLRTTLYCVLVLLV